MFDLKDQHIAQTLRFILDDWKKKSKKQRTQLLLESCLEQVIEIQVNEE